MSNKTHKLNDIIKPADIDLDKLFSLSYTFDNLKSLMSQLLKNQQTIINKVEDLESQINFQKNKSQKINKIQNNIDLRLKNLELGTSKFHKEVLNMKQNSTKKTSTLENQENLSIKFESNKNVQKEKKSNTTTKQN